jgi:hypothetical protein
VAVGVGVGRGVAVGVGVGDGVGVGATVILTFPASSRSSLPPRLRASKITRWVPAGSDPDHENRTPSLQSSPSPLTIVRVVPAIDTRTQSAGELSLSL